MSAGKVGRNDPCPCGSGKKYKHCCLRQGHIRRQAAGAQTGQARLWQGEQFETRLAQVKSLARMLMSHVPSEKAQELEHILEKADELEVYRARRAEIDAAAEVLEGQRAEFQAMLRNREEAVERAQRLFAEQRFAPLRFTADDVYHAFEAVGYPHRYRWDTEGDQELIDAAILHLADEELRDRLTRQLMMSLPEYVAAGRYLDAWLIQYFAYQTFEMPERINAFLFEMFHHGFVEWAKRVDGEQEMMLREMGFDPDQIRHSGMSLEELEAQLRARVADPEGKARIEAFFARHAMARGQAEAEAWDLERNSSFLLEREDADPLYLSAEEIQPWIGPLLDRFQPLKARALKAAERGNLHDAQLAKEMGNVMFGISKEMAVALFTPERVAQLEDVLKAYRNKLVQAKESDAVAHAHGALLALDHIRDPAQNPFLLSVCFVSLRAALQALSGRARTEV